MCVFYAGVYEAGVDLGAAVETGGVGPPAQHAAEEGGGEHEIETGIETGIETEGGEETRKGRTGEGLEGEEGLDPRGWCVSIRNFYRVREHCLLF